MPGALLAVDAPALSLKWQGASGVAETASGTPLTPDAPLRIASNTKTFVAVAVLRLWETERLGLDDPIARYLTEEQASILRGDGYPLEEITLRHLTC